MKQTDRQELKFLLHKLCDELVLGEWDEQRSALIDNCMIIIQYLDSQKGDSL